LSDKLYILIFTIHKLYNNTLYIFEYYNPLRMATGCGRSI